MTLEGITNGPPITSDNYEMSVSEAARLHQGSITVQGIISAVSPLQKLIKEESWECYYCKTLHYVDTLTIEDHKPVLYKTLKAPTKCKNLQCPSYQNANPTFLPHYAYTNAIIIELRNIDTFSDIDPLRVVVFDNDTIDVHTHLGEKTSVTGVLHVFRNPKQKAVSYLYAEFIAYESSQEVTISPTDKVAIEKFVKIKGNNAIDCMAAKMFAPDVIGYDIVKKGLLLAAASTNTNTEAKKIHLLLIGDPGTAKSTLLMRSTKLVLNSRYESAQNSSGKSLTAIVEKEDDYNVLRTGALAAAKGAICALNEIARMSFEDQKHLLDSMQEQHFSINKHGMSARIVSPTSVIASANPLYGEWKDPDIIDLDEIQILKPLRDRFDLIFVFRRTKDELSIRNYANKKIDMSDRPVPDYNSYLQKHIEYSKRFNPKLSEETKFMLKEYYIKVAATGHGSPRVLESLIAIAKMIARLKLKNIVSIDDAKEAQEFYNVILQELKHVVSIVSHPRDVAVKECIEILRINKLRVTFEELLKLVCQQNEQVSHYIGDKYTLEHNHRLRPILDILTNHSHIKRVNQRPIVLEWFDNFADHSDHSDHNANKIDKEIPGNIEVTQSHEQDGNIKDNSADASERSERSDGIDDLTKQSSVGGPCKVDFVNEPFENGNTKDCSAKISKSGNNNKLPNAGHINRIAPHSDIWICDDCTFRGDKWFMLEHNCKGLKE